MIGWQHTAAVLDACVCEAAGEYDGHTHHTQLSLTPRLDCPSAHLLCAVDMLFTHLCTACPLCAAAPQRTPSSPSRMAASLLPSSQAASWWRWREGTTTSRCLSMQQLRWRLLWPSWWPTKQPVPSLLKPCVPCAGKRCLHKQPCVQKPCVHFRMGCVCRHPASRCLIQCEMLVQGALPWWRTAHCGE